MPSSIKLNPAGAVPPHWLALLGLSHSEDAPLAVDIIMERTRRTTYAENLHRYTDEKFILEIGEAGVKLLCSGGRSLLYALAELARRMEDGSLAPGTYACCPSFRIRGYIEGFYGKPWSHQARVSVLKCMAKNRMNTVYYAPKDDAYHREKWRELYPAEELEQLAELLRLAQDYTMDFYYCIAPGLSMRYSSGEDFEQLKAKTEQLYGSGIRHFGLLLDDIDEELAFEEDRERYGEIVTAHIDVTLRYYAYIKALDPKNKLTVCPMLYNGRGDEYYISRYGQSIPPDISIFWTGRDVCSRDLTMFEALRFMEGTHHKPLYWDNYPVNDGTLHNEMHLGPVINRDKELYKYSEGIIANCMEYAECSKIPLITLADYLWDSESYVPDASWEKAVRQVVGEAHAEAFITFGDHQHTSCLKDDNSKRMYKLFQTVEKAFNDGDIFTALNTAGEYIEKMNACRDYLLSGEDAICGELRRWSEKFAVACDIINKLMESLTEGSESTKQEVFALIRQYDAMPAKLTDIDLAQEIGNLMNMNLTGE